MVYFHWRKLTHKSASDGGKNQLCAPVLRIRIHRIHVVLGLPDPDPLAMDPDPDSSIIKQK